MKFGDAIESARMGNAVAREGWNGKGMFVVYMPELNLASFNDQTALQKVNDRTAKWIGPDTPMRVRPYFAMYTAQKEWQPGWVPSQSDMLADDWHSLEPAYDEG